MCIIGQLPIMVNKIHVCTQMFKIKISSVRKDNESVTFFNFRKWS